MKKLTDIKAKRKIWVETKIKDIPESIKLVGSKWVFKKKKTEFTMPVFVL
jgi:hypothetical protein